MKVHSRSIVLRRLLLTFALAILASLLANFARAQPAAETQKTAPQTVQALFLSDIHFEPFWDPAKAAKLAAAPAADWNAILSSPDSTDRDQRFSALQKACPTRGEDTSYTLLQSSLRAERAQAPDAKFITVSGDLMAHSFSCKFAAVFPNASPGDYSSYAVKTIAFVIGTLRTAFHDVPVYAALGNNDSDCGDYQLDPNSEFLSAVGKVITADLRGPDRSRAIADFAAGGNFSAALPAPLAHTRLIVLDNLFMSRRYATCSGKDDTAPAAAAIAWLGKQLDQARQKHQKVWVMAHIPPGIDPYSTATKGKDVCSGNAPTTFLSSDALAETIANYGDVVRLAIFAHTHMDELRLLAPQNPHGNSVALKMVASISPVDGNNPSFTVAQILVNSATLKDYRVFAASNETGVDATWTEEYDFAKTYNAPSFSAASLETIIAGFQADPKAHTDASRSYIHNYGTGIGTREPGLVWHGYVCALKNDRTETYRDCLCAVPK